MGLSVGFVSSYLEVPNIVMKLTRNGDNVNCV
jgi:hypothetical protein